MTIKNVSARPRFANLKNVNQHGTEERYYRWQIVLVGAEGCLRKIKNNGDQ